jgi:hypothetical protein
LDVWKAIKTELVLDIKKQQNCRSHSDRQAQNIDGGVGLVFEKVTETYFEIILPHRMSWLVVYGN